MRDVNAYNRAHYKKNRKKLCAQRRARYLKDHEKHLVRSRKQYAKATKEGKRYGKNYPPATRPAPTRCECCQRVPMRALGVDHCHASNKFRGWLCTSCNAGIGMLGDNLKGLIRAVRYLEKNS